jgi:hypothetical protein
MEIKSKVEYLGREWDCIEQLHSDGKTTKFMTLQVGKFKFGLFVRDLLGVEVGEGGVCDYPNSEMIDTHVRRVTSSTLLGLIRVFERLEKLEKEA